MSASPPQPTTTDPTVHAPTSPASPPQSDQESLPVAAAAAAAAAVTFAPVPDQKVAADAGEAKKEEENGGAEAEEEEEEAECGFCLFMKGGGCKDAFIAWEKCVDDAEKSQEDIVDRCSEVTGLLRKCMDAHADYYEPILRAEQALVDAAADAAASSDDPGPQEEKKGKDS
ncbi:GCK domain [Musa troglodytarum]|uniref:GCK domain n=1 Tax=Musa troglodytarum TaxID=320322 RepID=A0A9E7IJF4_9LILI|nr:GCK domain [Musa troglodytarum]